MISLAAPGVVGKRDTKEEAAEKAEVSAEGVTQSSPGLKSSEESVTLLTLWRGFLERRAHVPCQGMGSTQSHTGEACLNWEMAKGSM